jgi:hypothetical protein
MPGRHRSAGEFNEKEDVMYIRDEALVLHSPHPYPGCDESATDWRAAFAETSQAYRRWCEAARGDKPEAYAVYRAAADREDAAARGYQVAVGHT